MEENVNTVVWKFTISGLKTRPVDWLISMVLRSWCGRRGVFPVLRWRHRSRGGDGEGAWSGLGWQLDDTISTGHGGQFVWGRWTHWSTDGQWDVRFTAPLSRDHNSHRSRHTAKVNDRLTHCAGRPPTSTESDDVTTGHVGVRDVSGLCGLLSARLVSSPCCHHASSSSWQPSSSSSSSRAARDVTTRDHTRGQVSTSTWPWTFSPAGWLSRSQTSGH